MLVSTGSGEFDDVPVVSAQGGLPGFVVVRVVFRQELVTDDDPAARRKIVLDVLEIAALVLQLDVVIREGGEDELETPVVATLPVGATVEGRAAESSAF
ncbi:hypothetical protein OG741_29100 [Streptomyces sp. NBC_01410]|uniref:hypothetical protein n=1 Tax=Streptomyces sp. NBC_01410 TaxID=2903856 RepID=UPI003254639E